MFLDPRDFEFLSTLTSRHHLIKEEFTRLGGDHELIVPYPQPQLCKKGWDLFPLYAYGKKIEEGCALCPETSRALETIPGMVTAFFSILRAGAKIDWHYDPEGYSEFVYRCHLGLVTPEGCTFRVGEETRGWEEGKTLLFKGDQPHEAHNPTTVDRAVLIVDVKLSPDTPLVMPPFDPQVWLAAIKTPSLNDR